MHPQASDKLADVLFVLMKLLCFGRLLELKLDFFQVFEDLQIHIRSMFGVYLQIKILEIRVAGPKLFLVSVAAIKSYVIGIFDS